MHQVIRYLTWAESHVDPQQVAQMAERETTQNHVTHPEGPFDYTSKMDTETSASGAGRWTEYKDTQMAFRAISKRGRTELDDAWKTTKREIDRNLEYAVTDLQENDCPTDLAEMDAEMLLSKNLGMVQHYLWSATEYAGTAHYIWDGTELFGACHDKMCWNILQDALDEDEDQDDPTEVLWVVPLDAHS